MEQVNAKRVNIRLMSTTQNDAVAIFLASDDGTPLKPQEIQDAVNQYMDICQKKDKGEE